MMKKQVIEYNGEAVGVVIPEADVFTFLAVKFNVWALDAQRFPSVEHVRAAVRQVMSGKGARDDFEGLDQNTGAVLFHAA